MRFRRPQRIYYRWVDPFDGKLLCEGSLGYSPRQSAHNYYTKFLKGMRTQFIEKCYSKELEGREARVEITIA